MRLPRPVRRAADAALAKKATDVVVIDLRQDSAFTDYFVVTSGTNQKQLVAIADSVEQELRDEGLKPRHLEGYPRQEWILMDYGDFVVHVFTGRSREFYDLERLWGGAQRQEIAP